MNQAERRNRERGEEKIEIEREMDAEREGGRKDRREGRVFMDVGKRRGGPCGALPDAAGAKPGGASTTTEIII